MTRLPEPLLKHFLDTLKEFTDVVPVASDTLREKSDFLVLEPGLAYQSSLADFNLTLSITLDTGMTVEIPDNEMKRALRGIEADGSVGVDRNLTEILVFSKANVDNTFSLGRSFLSQVIIKPWSAPTSDSH